MGRQQNDGYMVPPSGRKNKVEEKQLVFSPRPERFRHRPRRLLCGLLDLPRPSEAKGGPRRVQGFDVRTPRRRVWAAAPLGGALKKPPGRLSQGEGEREVEHGLVPVDDVEREPGGGLRFLELPARRVRVT